jgi:hypothetical protein
LRPAARQIDAKSSEYGDPGGIVSHPAITSYIRRP